MTQAPYKPYFKSDLAFAMLGAVVSCFFVAVFYLVFFPTVVKSEMESTNYKIPSDSINVGGGYSTSSSYRLEDTTGEVATGYSASASFNLHAGFQQIDGSFISITSPADVTLASISGLLGGVSTSSASWTVTTDSPAGYELAIKASTTPALASTESSFPDYSTAGADPDFAFDVSATSSAFGFTPEGSDITSRFKDNGSVCATGSSDTAGACWDGFATTSALVASSNTSNHTLGTETTVVFRAESGSSNIQTSGSYSAVITVTATAK